MKNFVTLEMKVPLGRLISMLELLHASPLDAQQTHFLAVARQSAEALLTTINDFGSTNEPSRIARSPVPHDSQVQTHTPCGTADPVDVNTLMERCLNDVNLFERLLNRFSQHVPDVLADLTSVAASGNHAEIARLARSIHGAAANASASELGHLAAAIEHLGHEAAANTDLAEAATTKVAELTAELDRCLAWFPTAIEKARATPTGAAWTLDTFTRR